MPQEQFWLMGTCVSPAGRLGPDPIGNAEPCETPVVGHVVIGDVRVPLDVAHPGADLSPREMVLYHRTRLFLHCWMRRLRMGEWFLSRFCIHLV